MGAFPPVAEQPPIFRGAVTGAVLGGALSLCNIYSGLKVGWGFNMSITAALLAFGFWHVSGKAFHTKPFGILENNLNQTAASAGASISSAGLVAPIPALTMLTGQTLGWSALAAWTFAVSLVGIYVAILLRRQMLIVDELRFPFGIAAAETLKEMYSKGEQALVSVRALIGAGVLSAGLKWAVEVLHFAKWPLPGSVALKSGSTATLGNLTLALDPSLLLFACGALSGLRAGISILIGSIFAYAYLAPMALENGWATAGKPADAWFSSLTKWLLWPGVAMMVTSALTTVAFSWRSFVRALSGTSGATTDSKDDLPRAWMTRIGLFVGFVAIGAQMLLFGISMWNALLGVLLSVVLAVVALRVSGESGITPVGPMGKVTQLTLGIVAPGDAAANLMTANVTGGAASQAGDLMQDLKTGLLLGAAPKTQMVAQTVGALAGAAVGSLAYLILVPDPKNQLLTDEWPAPSVAAWKAVAEVFQKGLSAMPEGSIPAMAIAGALGIILAVLEKTLPKKFIPWVLSPASLGLALVIPGYNSISIFFGALVAYVLAKKAPAFSEKYTTVIAAGLVAGESLMGVSIAIKRMLAPG